MSKKKIKKKIDIVEWDGRPDNVCQGCGYHTCCCPLQTKRTKNKLKSAR